MVIATCNQVLAGAFQVAAGASNTLTTTWADKSESQGTIRIHTFNHPFVQTFLMFLAEFACLGIYFAKILYDKLCGNTDDEEPKHFNPLLLLPASLMDMIATSMLYVSLILTNPASFQLLQAPVIIFTASLSVALLRHSFGVRKWIGVVIITFDGLVVVGVADILLKMSTNVKDINGIIAGDLLILAAQIIIAFQMIYEEYILKTYNVHPAKAAGFEGLFGAVVIGICFVPFYYINGGQWFHSNPYHSIEDPQDAFIQISNNYRLLIANVIYFISLVVYNMCVLTVTKEYNALTRMVLDNIRTIPVWIVSLAIGWESFFFLHVIGFLLLLFGECLYFDITILPLCHRYILNRNKYELLTSVPTEGQTSPLARSL